MSPTWRFRLLGQFSLHKDNDPVGYFSNRRDEELLALLLLGHDVPQSRDDLAKAIWPDVELSQARKHLSYNLFVLKRNLDELGAPNFILNAGSRALRVARFVQADIWDFNEAVTIVAADPNRVDELEHALSLYSGGLLPHHPFPWLTEQQESFRQRFALLGDLVEDVTRPSDLRRDLFQHLPPSSWRSAPPIRRVLSPSESVQALRELAVNAEAGLMSASRAAWLEQIDAAKVQLDDLFTHSIRTGDTGDALDIASRLWRYWLLRGETASGWLRISELFSNQSVGSHERRARAHHALGMLASYQGDHDDARRHLDTEQNIWKVAQEVALKNRETEPGIWREDGITAGMLRALTGSAVARYNASDFGAAGTEYDQALAIARVLRDRDAIIRLLFNRALVAIKVHDASLAKELLEERLSFLEEGSDDERRGTTHAHLATTYLLEGDEQLAADHAEVALMFLSEDSAPADRIHCHQVLGRIAHNQGELQASIAHFETALALARQMDGFRSAGKSMRYLALVLRDAGDEDSGEKYAADARLLLTAAGADDELSRFEKAWNEGVSKDPAG